jgi:two-component system CheB/CheR fusion protein
MSLDIGLPLEKLRPHVRTALSGKSERAEIVVGATNRLGKPIQCRVTFLPMTGSRDGSRTVAGLIMMMEPVGDGAQPHVRAATR